MGVLRRKFEEHVESLNFIDISDQSVENCIDQDDIIGVIYYTCGYRNMSVKEYEDSNNSQLPNEKTKKFYRFLKMLILNYTPLVRK